MAGSDVPRAEAAAASKIATHDAQTLFNANAMQQKYNPERKSFKAFRPSTSATCRQSDMLAVIFPLLFVLVGVTA